MQTCISNAWWRSRYYFSAYWQVATARYILQARHITNLHTKNDVRSTAQISGLFGQQKHSDLVSRIWLQESRNVTKDLVNPSCTFIVLSAEKQKNNFVCHNSSRLRNRHKLLLHPVKHTQDGDINCHSTQREIKQVAKKADDDPVATFAWEFVNIALATLKYWSPDEQLDRLNKAKEVVVARCNSFDLL